VSAARAKVSYTDCPRPAPPETTVDIVRLITDAVH
jgi:hypothetical protein